MYRVNFSKLKPPIIIKAGRPTIKKAGQPIIIKAIPYLIASHPIGETDSSSKKMTYDLIGSEYVDKNGEVWMGTRHSGICVFNGTQLKYYTGFQGNNDTGVNCIMRDREGKLWIGTERGFTYFDGVQFTTFTSAEGLPENIIYCIADDKNGNIWLGTSEGACCFDGKTFLTYKKAQGLCSDYIDCITVDSTGNIWLGTGIGKGDRFHAGNEQGGVSCFDGKNFTNYTTAQGLVSNALYNIAIDKKGTLWFSGQGICQYDGKKFTCYDTTNHQLPTIFEFGLFPDMKGNIWIKTVVGIWIYNGKSFSKFDELFSNNIRSIAEDEKGTMWFGTVQGQLIKFNGTESTTIQVF